MTTRHRASALALALALGSCDAPTMTSFEPGYDPLTLVPLFYHWDAGHEITIFVDPNQPAPATDLEGAVREAIAAWEAVGPLGEVRMRVVSDYRQADVIVHHSAAPRLVATELCDPLPTGAGGYTFFCIDENLQAIPLLLVDGSGGRVQMDVAINRDAVDADSTFRAVVAHELGHVLGIGAHSPNMTDLMFGSPRRRTPTTLDARTLLYVLWHTPAVRF